MVLPLISHNRHKHIMVAVAKVIGISSAVCMVFSHKLFSFVDLMFYVLEKIGISSRHDILFDFYLYC